MSELTGDDGTASPPELPNGGYDVIATLNDVVGTSFVGLQVVGKQEVTTFSMDLTEQVRRVEVPPIRDHVKAFQGIVTDPAGAALPGASIVVVRKESEAKDVALRLKAGANGHFSAHLAEGSYIAFFFLRGFRTAIVPLEVTKDGAGDLRASLQVQSCP